MSMNDRIEQASDYLREAMKEAKAAGVSVEEFDARVNAAARTISPVKEADGLLALVRDLRQFLPMERPEEGPLPAWIVEVRERADDVLKGRER